MVFQKCFEVSSIPDPCLFFYHGKQNLGKLYKSLPFYLIIVLFLHAKAGTRHLVTDNLHYFLMPNITSEGH